jgi:hypothetical protein
VVAEQAAGKVYFYEHCGRHLMIDFDSDVEILGATIIDGEHGVITLPNGKKLMSHVSDLQSLQGKISWAQNVREYYKASLDEAPEKKKPKMDPVVPETVAPAPPPPTPVADTDPLQYARQKMGDLFQTVGLLEAELETVTHDLEKAKEAHRKWVTIVKTLEDSE